MIAGPPLSASFPPFWPVPLTLLMALLLMALLLMVPLLIIVEPPPIALLLAEELLAGLLAVLPVVPPVVCAKAAGARSSTAMSAAAARYTNLFTLPPSITLHVNIILSAGRGYTHSLAKQKPQMAHLLKFF